MMHDPLNYEEQKTLLKLAREAIQTVLVGEEIIPLDINSLSEKLRENGASFVTLTKHGNLRGCIGTLEPHQPLAEDVREHAIAAALHDYRFHPVDIKELSEIMIEISRLTIPIPLFFSDQQDLLNQLHAGEHGVILTDGFRRATFLPQVWSKIPDKIQFLSQLCIKMGSPPDYWKSEGAKVFTYYVEEFHE